MTAPIELDAVALGRRVLAGELSAEAACAAHLRRARSREPVISAFLDLDDDDVTCAARSVDQRLASGEKLSVLAGVPVAVKDNLCTRGRPTTCGSRMLEGYRSPHEATAVTRLRAAGAVPFGKTNCDEFGMGSSTEHSALARTRNPWNPDRVPGGSSGGSAAAVAARSAAVALGSDTGGSIRQPAAFCGLVGLKPTHGRVSRHGLVAFASSLDQVGPIARCVADAAAVLQVIAGPDALDATSSTLPVPDLEAIVDGNPGTSPFRFGVPPEVGGDGVAEDVRAAVEAACTALEAVGGTRVDVSLSLADLAVATYYVVATAEASSNLARHDGVRYGHRAGGHGDCPEVVARSRSEGFGPEVKRRILLGTHVLSAGHHDRYYGQASRVRSLIAREFDGAFSRADVLVSATAPTTAFELGAKVDDPLSMYLSDTCTVPPSLAGLPAMSLPCGLGADGLPVGVQLTAPAWHEAALLDVASRLESELAFAERHAPPA